MKIRKHTIFRLIWFTGVIIFFVWQWSNYQPHDLPDNTFIENDSVSVKESDDEITFIPKKSNFESEIIFFQGGLVAPKAYAPLCRQMAKRGYTCHLMKMDWRMPLWDYDKISNLFDLKKGNYIIGGHSQGAKMAAQFVYENPGLMRGLFLLGTSHPRDFDLSDRTLPTIKIYGEFDGLADVSEVLENKGKLPKNASLKMIEGANHSQFGYLGKLLTDDPALIETKEQQRLTLDLLVRYFEKVEKGK